MNNQEIELFSRELNCDPGMMKHLQDLFLYKQKVLNTKSLRKYLMKNGRLVNNRLTIPSSLRKYFIQSKKPYANVKSRVYQSKSQYQPIYGPYRPKKKMGFSERVF